VGMERGPFSLMSVNEEMLDRESSGSGLTKRTLTAAVVPLTTRHSPSQSAKVGTEIRQPVAVAELVKFACRLKTAEFHCDNYIHGEIGSCYIWRNVDFLCKATFTAGTG
jgi:hypothetical protein